MRSLTATELFYVIAFISSVTVLSSSFGDEAYQNCDGHFWAFNPSGIAIIDPISGYAIKTVSIPTQKWGNTVYIRDQAQIRHYVFANDYDNGLVNVFDYQTAELLAQVSLGPDAYPLHIFAVYYNDEVWTHDDGTGTYDVFRMAQVSARESTGVQSNTIHVILIFFYFIFVIYFFFLYLQIDWSWGTPVRSES